MVKGKMFGGMLVLNASLLLLICLLAIGVIYPFVVAIRHRYYEVKKTIEEAEARHLDIRSTAIPNLDLEEFEFELEGRIINNSDITLPYIDVKFECYDENGEVVFGRTHMLGINGGIPPGSAESFDINMLYPDKDIDSCLFKIFP